MLFVLAFSVSANESTYVENPSVSESESKITVSVSPTSLKMGIGEEYKLKLTLNGTQEDTDVLFSSSDSDVVTVSDNGTITALKEGTAIISSTHNGESSSCTVTVLPAPEKLTLNKTKITMGVGETYKFKYTMTAGSGSVTKSFVSADKSVVAYQGACTFKALKVGKTTVTLSTFNGISASCEITVLPLPKTISSKYTSYTVQIGHSVKAQILTNSGSWCSSYTYENNDSSIAICNSSGKITGKKIGSITVTVTSSNGKKCNFTINVTAMKVPFVSQLPKYPTGCEGASATSLLRYYGYNVTLDDMITAIPRKNIAEKDGKRWGPDINEYFVGTPTGGYTSANPGYGAFSPCVTKSLQTVIDNHNGKHIASKISGCSFHELLDHISQGRPAIVWATYMMKQPTEVNSWYITETGKYFEYPRGTHVMVLVGYSDTEVSIIDPYKGPVTFNISTFEKRWNLLGKQAIVIM